MILDFEDILKQWSMGDHGEKNPKNSKKKIKDKNSSVDISMDSF